jgi:TPR repeat protein
MLSPIGFWSYTRSDDRNARGRLSQLRSLLASELESLYGRFAVQLFQDVEMIPPGADWDARIHQALTTAHFIVPIVTPGFLQSSFCCREIRLFREKEAVMGRADLIFPIHYIDVTDIDARNERECCSPEVLNLLRQRQWTDLRDVRFKDPTEEDVLVRVEGLARSIRTALRQPRPAIRAAQAIPVRTSRPAPPPEQAPGASPAASSPQPDQDPATGPSGKAGPYIQFDDSGWLILGHRVPSWAMRVAGLCFLVFVLFRLFAPMAPASGTPHECDRVAQPPRQEWRGLDQSVPGVPLAGLDVAAALGACTAAARTYPRETRFAAYLARALYKAQDYGRAYEVAMPAAMAGHAMAQNSVGVLLLEGRGVARNDVLALDWFRRAASQGYMRAQFSVGWMLEQGRGAVADASGAAAFYRAAADQGFAPAQVNLGLMLLNGRGVQRDDVQAAILFQRAAEQEDSGGRTYFAWMLAEGRGVPRDEGRAVTLYRQAAAANNPAAQYYLSEMLRIGRATRPNPQESLALLRQSAATDFALAQYTLGWRYENAIGVAKDEEAAVRLYRLAAAQGNTAARESLRRLNRSTDATSR